MQIGAGYRGEGRCKFVLWAPRAEKVAVRILGENERLIPMARDEDGYWRALGKGVRPGTDYLFLLDPAGERPDPASAWQPQGVHGPSRIVDHAAFAWTDAGWRGVPPEEMVIYELHVGTFTPEGTFAAILARLEELKELGITAIELMPVAQFPGERNWGYDGACPFAVQESYGGPEGLKTLVNACHRAGLAVLLDVVYNHLGPEGNYLRDFGPYFTDRYRTPWGEAVNFDGPGSDQVRNYFIENARHWFTRYHVDGLRLDAIHAIFDFSAKPFLLELAEKTAELCRQVGRDLLLIAESDLNDVRVIRPGKIGGYGLHAQWNDDFHHALHTLLTGERNGYYQDFGRAEDLVKAYREGFVYDWRYSSYRRRRHGSSSADRPGRQWVVCSQNHDQVGNRLRGERLIRIAGFEAAKLAAGAVLLAPCIPLLFMGEEYGEEAPFLYFVRFNDRDLAKAVRRGREEEFAAFDWAEAPPDPQARETFEQSRLNWAKRQQEPHRCLLAFYRELLRLRRRLPALAALDRQRMRAEVLAGERLIALHRRQEEDEVLGLLNFAEDEVSFVWPEPLGRWLKRLDSADFCWRGPGTVLPERVDGGMSLTMTPQSCVLYQRER